jgi:hypothetical protein
MHEILLVAMIALAGAVVLTCSVIGMRAFDQLIVLLRTHAEDAWRKAGRPYPYWSSGGLTWEYSLRTGLASHRAWFSGTCQRV